MKVYIEVKTVYGVDQYYPANEVAVKFAALLGTKTLTQKALSKILDLGVEVFEVRQGVIISKFEGGAK